LDVETVRGAIVDDDFTGYLLHADPAWLENVLQLEQAPVYWGKTPEPSSLAIREGTTLFFRKSREMPPVVKGYAKISSITKAVPLEEAWGRYGRRLGYNSIQNMIGVSSEFEGETQLTPESRIYCAELEKFIPCNLSVDKDLAGIGVSFPMAATKGKKLSTEETEAILDLISSKAPRSPQALAGNVEGPPPSVEEPQFAFVQKDFDSCTGQKDDAHYLRQRFVELLDVLKKKLDARFGSFNSYVAYSVERPRAGQKVVTYRDHMWLGFADPTIARAQGGVQLQVGIGRAEERRGPFTIEVFIDRPARDARVKARRHLLEHTEDFRQELAKLRGYTVRLGGQYKFGKNVEGLTPKELADTFLSNFDREGIYVGIGRTSPASEIIGIGTEVVERIARSFDELYPVYTLMRGGAEPPKPFYLVSKAQESGEYLDNLREGGQYHFDTDVANYKKVTAGSQILFDRLQNGQHILLAKATVANIAQGNDLQGKIPNHSEKDRLAILEHYESFQPAIVFTSAMEEQLKNSPGYNAQHSIHVVTSDVFERLQHRLIAAPYTLEQLCNDTLHSVEFFQQLEKALEEDHQIILYGPPGTGKTFLAESFARYFAGSDNTKVVVFHPSYSYEDFVEGLRPEGNSLRLQDGCFKEMAAKAKVSEGKFVLVIDEINRGKVDRIFGELVHSLEREKPGVQLVYSRQELEVPSNLYILATMNSTDRSIALVDFALRRRFAFKQIGTDLDILRRWYEKNPPKIQPERIIELLRKLNEKIVQDERLGESFEIGHSYFMKPEIDKERLGRIWDLHILPLIQEYYPAQPQDVEGFKELFTDLTKDFNPS